MIKKQFRISEQELLIIKNLFSQYFLKGDQLWIFGSRTDLSKKGGDLDLYIETQAITIDNAIKMKMDFLWELENKIGEQKIDLVLNMLNFPHPLPIHQIAKQEGIRII